MKGALFPYKTAIKLFGFIQIRKQVITLPYYNQRKLDVYSKGSVDMESDHRLLMDKVKIKTCVKKLY